jgi:hypothetical protein
MPFQLARDDTAKRIVAIGEGEFRVEDAIEVLAKLAESDAWTYGVLLDARHMSGPLPVADLKAVSTMTVPSGGRGERRGPVAIVATSPSLYAMACAYAALSKPGRIAVFRDRVEADQWLTRQMLSPD